ncbi:hypothetical protein [Lelliottia amnigena]|uniref:hypothetical protein n=1 Tax=Lelliottia amnigena TaxID=61646 RepID=UPI001C5C9D97|nr:hypothetical protein [Lelliottia amnigena]QXZ19099.1 hypothetical protein I6L75_18690 [Lelliottia amnigena]
MKITRYIVNGGSVMLREDESYEHGQCLWVRDSDYNKIQSQLTALTSQLESVVAENAALKSAESNLVRNIINDLGDTEFQYEKVQTPATSAFLAEVRASGVEMAAKSEQFSTWVQQGLRSFAIGVRQGGAE